ncbi:MAG: hypothetical protein ACRENP_19005 [Longimicrobiales bacterium]
MDPEISFASQRTDWSATLADFANISAGPRTLLVSGLMLTPNECFSLRAGLQVRSGVITVTITGTQASNLCGPSAGAYNYQFLTSGLDPGSFQVRIVHTAAGVSQTVTEENIVIN